MMEIDKQRRVLKRVFDVVLIEDNPADVNLIERLIRKVWDCSYKLYVFESGETALEFLNNCKKNHQPFPSLVLLDLNLPGIGGKDTLHEMKQDESLRRIPVVIFSTSSSQYDIRQAYEGHANSFIVKPVDIETFENTVKVLQDYWLKTVQLSL